MDISFTCFAPDRIQNKVINHNTGKSKYDERNMMDESARILGQQVQPLSSLSSQEYEVMIIPGGIGNTTSLSNYEDEGAEMNIDNDIQAAITDFNNAGKYIGVCQNSTILIARHLGDKNGGPGAQLAMAANDEMINAVNDLGNTVIETSAFDVVHDEVNKIVSSPCKLNSDASPADMFTSMKSMVDMLLEVSK